MALHNIGPQKISEYGTPKQGFLIKFSTCREQFLRKFGSTCFLILILCRTWQHYFVLIDMLVLCYYIKDTSLRKEMPQTLLARSLPAHPLYAQIPFKKLFFFCRCSLRNWGFIQVKRQKKLWIFMSFRWNNGF